MVLGAYSLQRREGLQWRLPWRRRHLRIFLEAPSAQHSHCFESELCVWRGGGCRTCGSTCSTLPTTPRGLGEQAGCQGCGQTLRVTDKPGAQATRIAGAAEVPRDSST